MDDALEIPPYEPVPGGVVMTRVEDGFTEEAQPQQAPAPADAAAVAASPPAAPVSRPAFSPVRFPTPKALLMAEYLNPEETAAAVARIAARIPPAKRPMPCAGVALGQLPDPLPESENPAALFKNGWLRKGGGAFIVAPSGVGKSSLTIQAAMCWALGREFHGIFPVRRLRIGIIQSEDDRTEVSWFRNSIRDGLVSDFGFSLRELNDALGKDDPGTAYVEMFRLVGKTGQPFVDAVGAILDNRPDIDLLIVNPFHAYFGADVSKNSDVSQFLRTWLDPEIKSPLDDGKDRAAVIFVHHTNKPPAKDDEREAWGVDQFASYIGAGGAELVNWARAVLSLMPTKVPGVYRLCAGKRGQRLEWEDVSSGKATRCKVIKHGEKNRIIWLPCDEADMAAVTPVPKAGKNGAVGGDGGGGKPATRETNEKCSVWDAVGFAGNHSDQSENKLVTNIASLTGAAPTTIRRRLTKAVQDGYLTVVKGADFNSYSITASGEKYVYESASF